MSKINYIKGDLFQITKSVTTKTRPILAHSCNCFGVWGGGIAYQFKLRYPASYQKYHDFCLSKSPHDIIGKTLVIKDDKIDIVCLFTSLDGSDSEQQIVEYTKLAIEDMIEHYGTKNLEVNLPKINSGIFGVPWEMTEEILHETGLKYNVYVV